MIGDDTVLCTVGGFSVTRTLLRTPRQSFGLAHIDHVACRRPLFLAAAPVTIGSALIALAFADILYAREIALLIGLPGLVSLIACETGCLSLHSLSLRDERVWGRYSHLTRVRSAIERAMRETRTEGKPEAYERGERAS